MLECTSRQSRCPSTNRHSGLSLLEVIIATAVLAASGLALFSIIGMGSKYALRAEEATYAQHFAQSVLDEWLTAPTSVGTEQTGTFEEAPHWSYQVESQSLEEPGLCAVTVEIFHSQNSQQFDAAVEPIYRLTRWVRVPSENSAGEAVP